MSLPNADRAIVDPAKVRDYLLSHPVGRFKAAFFLSLGYSQDRWEVWWMLCTGELSPRLVTVMPR
jgi:hypothetical protein